MTYTCACSNVVSFDLVGAGAFALRLRCHRCSKWLSLADDSQAFAEVELSAKEQLSRMVALAAADGSVSTEEVSLLESTAKVLGVDAASLQELISRMSLSDGVVPIQSTHPYPNREDFKDESDGYDWQRFALHAKDLRFDDPILRRYRDDVVHMLGRNAERAKEMARRWNDRYDESSDATEWDEILEHRQRCMDIAAKYRGLRDDLQRASREDFATFVAAAALTASDESW